MSDWKEPGSTNEFHDPREEINRILDRVEKLHEQLSQLVAEFVDLSETFAVEINEKIAETGRIISETSAQIDKTSAQMTETRKKVAELTESEKRLDKRTGDLGNKYGDFTEEIEKLSIRQILQVSFQAISRGKLKVTRRNMDTLEVDAWGVTHDDVKAVYLITKKNKLKNVHFEELRQQVERFRFFMPELKEYSIYQVVAVEKANEAKRKRVWDSGLYLIDIVNGAYRLAEEPEGFEPKVHRGVPKLRIVHEIGNQGQAELDVIFTQFTTLHATI